MPRPLRLSAADHAALTQRAKPARVARAKRRPQTVGEFVAEELRGLPWARPKRQGETGTPKRLPEPGFVAGFVLLRDPIGKGRPRMTKAGHAFTPSPTRAYEHAVKVEAKIAMSYRDPWQVPVAVRIEVWMPIPASWSKVKKEKAEAGYIRPTSPRNDLDNVVKAVLDACNDVLWLDDGQVCELTASRRYAVGGETGIRVEARAIAF